MYPVQTISQEKIHSDRLTPVEKVTLVTTDGDNITLLENISHFIGHASTDKGGVVRWNRADLSVVGDVFIQMRMGRLILLRAMLQLLLLKLSYAMIR